ncbi:hypothetical protein JTB14_027097 [Gonioctena quinquepunctata]|nr:hypothetical protein JTB14_027097 [Gonioctena quinquepunctata]
MEMSLSMVITPDNYLEVVTVSEKNFKVVFEKICKMAKEKKGISELSGGGVRGGYFSKYATALQAGKVSQYR